MPCRSTLCRGVVCNLCGKFDNTPLSGIGKLRRCLQCKSMIPSDSRNCPACGKMTDDPGKPAGKR